VSATSDRPDRLWPLGIACGLLVVVVMNAIFAIVAVRTAPQIEPSYAHSQSR
jgi:hypothetical protein